MVNNKENKLLGVRIDQLSLDEFIDDTENAINSDRKILLSCANPHSLVTAQSDSDFMNALNSSDHVVADGAGIILVSNFLGLNKIHRITGHDYFSALMSRANAQDKKYKVFFMGSSGKVLNLIEHKTNEVYKNINLVGTYSPPFGDWTEEENNKIIDAINLANPDILWIGMTAPKQEKWMFINKDKLDVSFIGAIGAVFDFYAGTVKRSPEWACKMGLEWLPRLVREPRRLFRRNFISSPLFLLMVFKEKLGLMKS